MSQSIQDDVTFGKGLYLDFILDHLSGCKWNCSGCGVNKFGQSGWGNPDDGARTVKLMKEFRAKSWVTDHLEIGPTDFMSAANTFETLLDPHVQELTRIFNSTLLTTTFLEPEQDRFVDLINRAFSPDQVINFFVVIDAAKLENENYLELVIKNKNRFLERIHVRSNPIPHPLFNAFVHKDGQGFNSDFLEVNRQIREKWGRGAYHTFSCGRSFTNDTERVLQTLDWLNSKFNKYVDQSTIQDANFYYGGLGRDGFSKHYAYRMGKWWQVPILYSPFVNEYPEFEIPMGEDWSVRKFEKFEEDLIVDQFQGLAKKPECASCAHNYMCVQYAVLKLQDALGVTRCIVPREAILKSQGSTSLSPALNPECS